MIRHCGFLTSSRACSSACFDSEHFHLQNKMNLRLLIEKDEMTQRYSAVFPEIPGCASAGDSEDEAILNAKEALELWFDVSDFPIPENSKLVQVAI